MYSREGTRTNSTQTCVADSQKTSIRGGIITTTTTMTTIATTTVTAAAPAATTITDFFFFLFLLYAFFWHYCPHAKEAGLCNWVPSTLNTPHSHPTPHFGSHIQIFGNDAGWARTFRVPKEWGWDVPL